MLNTSAMIRTGFAALLALTSAASSARADLQASFTSASPSEGINYTLNSANGSTNAGVMNFTVSGGTDASKFSSPFKAFCADLVQTIGGGTNTFSVVNPSALPQAVANSALPSLITSRLTELWGKYYSQTTTSAGAAAFQVSVWEIIYDTSATTGPSLTSGKFSLQASSQSGTKYTLASSWLASLNGDTSAFTTNFSGLQVVGIASGSVQDQVTLAAAPANPVPAPAGLVLGLIGVGALFGRSRMTRRA